MRTGIATVCLSGTLEEKIHACAKAGFDGIEIFEQDLTVSPLSPEEIRALAERCGVRLDLFQPFRDVDGVTEEVFAANLNRAEAKFALMNRLGIDLMLVCSNVATLTIPDDEVIAQQLRRLGVLAEHYGVRIAYEALAWGAHVNTYRHAQAIVDRADHPAVGTCLDSFHILSRGDDPADIARIDPAKIFFVQLADAPAMSLDVLSWSRHYRLFPGQGGFDLAGFMTHLVRSGYDGAVSLEIFNDTFRQSDAESTARDGMRSLLWLQDRTASLLAGERTTMALDRLPDAGPPRAIDFAEIRTEDSESVAQLLDQLGFAFRGQHRRKPVQLWTHGEVRIILNGQQARGVEASLSALGLQSAAPAVAIRRAEALRAVPVPRHHTADEQPLRGVRSPDGRALFTSAEAAEPAWAAEFGRGEAIADAGLITRIDHINLAQPWDAFDESVLFAESVLQVQTRPVTEVPSPRGLVRSQVLHTPDDDIRLVFNIVPQGLNASDRYPEHIALATDDVVAVARHAREAGMEFLPIPQNYYDDLAARFDLADEELATLAELDLLYDRDERGEFRHFYTATVGGLFLEVVERRHGYDGFGAPNAAVRFSAQYERSRRDGIRKG